MGDDLNLEFKLRVQLLMRFKNKFSKNEKTSKKIFSNKSKASVSTYGA